MDPLCPSIPSSSRPRPALRRHGFTLVELLVVIGIIAVLMGLLLPVMGKVRRSAIRTTCAAQLRDIGNQFNMYLNANKMRLPRINPDGSTYGTDRELVPGALPMALLLKPFNGGAFKVFRCPADIAVNEKFETDFKQIDENDDGVPDTGMTMLRKNAESWFEAIGSSYEYSSRFNVNAEVLDNDPDRILMQTWPARLADLTTRTRRDGTLISRPPSQIWVFRDCDPFHGKVSGSGDSRTFSADARNHLYADFHVGTTAYGG